MHCTNCELSAPSCHSRKAQASGAELCCSHHSKKIEPQVCTRARQTGSCRGQRQRRSPTTEGMQAKKIEEREEVANERLRQEDCVCLLSGSNNSSKETPTCHSHTVLTSFAPRRPKCNQSASGSRVAKPRAAELHSYFPCLQSRLCSYLL